MHLRKRQREESQKKNEANPRNLSHLQTWRVKACSASPTRVLSRDLTLTILTTQRLSNGEAYIGPHTNIQHIGSGQVIRHNRRRAAALHNGFTFISQSHQARRATSNHNSAGNV